MYYEKTYSFYFKINELVLYLKKCVYDGVQKRGTVEVLMKKKHWTAVSVYNIIVVLISFIWKYFFERMIFRMKPEYISIRRGTNWLRKTQKPTDNKHHQPHGLPRYDARVNHTYGLCVRRVIRICHVTRRQRQRNSCACVRSDQPIRIATKGVQRAFTSGRSVILARADESHAHTR